MYTSVEGYVSCIEQDSRGSYATKGSSSSSRGTSHCCSRGSRSTTRRHFYAARTAAGAAPGRRPTLAHSSHQQRNAERKW